MSSLLTISLGPFALGTASAAAASLTAHASCRITFQVSTQRLHVGQHLVLTWKASGAQRLTANWISRTVPLAGSADTTRHRPGRYSYAVTGTNGTATCGSAGVDVVFVAGALASTASSPSGGSTTSASVSASVSAPGSAAIAPTAHPGTSYPRQSPTGGSGVPWYQQPNTLLAISASALLSALALLNRDRLRATIVHRH